MPCLNVFDGSGCDREAWRCALILLAIVEQRQLLPVLPVPKKNRPTNTVEVWRKPLSAKLCWVADCPGRIDNGAGWLIDGNKHEDSREDSRATADWEVGGGWLARHSTTEQAG